MRAWLTTLLLVIAEALQVKDQRYCEVLFVRPTPNRTFVADVFNTFGLNTCPAPFWDVLTPESAKDATSIAAVLNGPRYWLMDEFGPNTKPIIKDRVVKIVGSIPMALVAQVPVTLPVSTPNYTPTSVIRNADFWWRAGSTVFYLKHKGKNYIMQSYSQQVDPSLNLTTLSALRRRLQLPRGWSFSVKKLKKDVNVTTPSLVGGNATVGLVVQDEFRNTYTFTGNLDKLLNKKRYDDDEDDD